MPYGPGNRVRVRDWITPIVTDDRGGRVRPGSPRARIPADADPVRQRRHPDLRPHGGGHDLARAPTGSPTRWVAGPAPLQFQIEPGPCAGFFRFRTGENDTPTPSLRILHPRSEEHTSELQSLMRNTYAVFCFNN